MVSPTTFPRLDLGCGKTIVSCFCNLDHRLNFLDLQNKMKNYQSTLFSFSFSSRSFSIHIHYIQFTLTATSLIVQSPLLLHNPQNNNHRNVSCFSFTCHWFLLNKKKKNKNNSHYFNQQPQNRNQNPTSFRHQSYNFQRVSLLTGLLI